MCESGNLTKSQLEDMTECINCDGYDEACGIYMATRRFISKAYKMREEVKREMRRDGDGRDRREEEFEEVADER